MNERRRRFLGVWESRAVGKRENDFKNDKKIWFFVFKWMNEKKKNYPNYIGFTHKKNHIVPNKGHQIADVVGIWRICCWCRALNGVEKDIRQRNMLNWVVVQRPIDAVDSMIKRAHFGLWASKQSMVYSISEWERLCIVNAMTGTRGFMLHIHFSSFFPLLIDDVSPFDFVAIFLLRIFCSWIVYLIFIRISCFFR